MRVMVSAATWGVMWRGKRTARVARLAAVVMVIETTSRRTESHVTRALGHVQPLDVPDLERRLAVAVEDLRRGLATWPPARVDKLLEEDLAEDAVGLFFEDGAEDDGHAVG